MEHKQLDIMAIMLLCIVFVLQGIAGAYTAFSAGGDCTLSLSGPHASSP